MHGLSNCVSWVLKHVGSSQIRGHTHVPCIGSWILKHRATREVPMAVLYTNKLRHKWSESLSHVTQMGADRIQLLSVWPDPLCES